MSAGYENLSDDDLINLMLRKAEDFQRRQSGSLASGVRRKQDQGVRNPAKRRGNGAPTLPSPQSSAREKRLSTQPDLLAELDRDNGARSRPDDASGSDNGASGEIRSLDQLSGAAASLAGHANRNAAPADRLAARLRMEVLAGGDPLGECYSRLRSASIRRQAGITLTPLRIVASMMRWAAAQIGSGQAPPVRIVDPGSGTGRFAMAAARLFPDAAIIAVENDPDLLVLLRANLAAAGLTRRVSVEAVDFRSLRLDPAHGPTLFIGNPPYVRHHRIGAEWKQWYKDACARQGIAASQLAGLHLHFFAKIAEIAERGDFGCLITAAEWLDVGYGAALRSLLAGALGGTEIHVLQPTAEAFPGTMTTACVTGFRIGERPRLLRLRNVETSSGLDRLQGGRLVSWTQAAQTPKWSPLVRDAPRPPPGTIELGEICRVHRGQVTGANRIWIAGAHARELPEALLKPTVTRAEELIAAEPVLESHLHLARVIDLPPELDCLEAADRAKVERFIAWARAAGADRGYIARHRRPWWAVRLLAPAPIVCTYMARRMPAFVRNRARAHLINIAHGIYPRGPLTDAQLMGLVAALRLAVREEHGRRYSGGLVKFEPRELEHIAIPRLDNLELANFADREGKYLSDATAVG